MNSKELKLCIAKICGKGDKRFTYNFKISIALRRNLALIICSRILLLFLVCWERSRFCLILVFLDQLRRSREVLLPRFLKIYLWKSCDLNFRHRRPYCCLDWASHCRLGEFLAAWTTQPWPTSASAPRWWGAWSSLGRGCLLGWWWVLVSALVAQIPSSVGIYLFSEGNRHFFGNLLGKTSAEFWVVSTLSDLFAWQSSLTWAPAASLAVKKRVLV